MATREARLARAFVDVADTLVADFEVVAFLTTVTARCADLLGASEAGIVLASENAHLEIAASTSPAMNVLELFELQHREGPCIDCCRSGQPVRSGDVNGDFSRWPAFAPEALAAGFRSVAAVPMRLREQTIGSLNLAAHAAETFRPADLIVAQALAEVATIGLLQHRAAVDARRMSDQLQHALTSRVVIEQAKGILAMSAGISMDAAFSQLRKYSQDNNRPLVEVAREVVEQTLSHDQTH